MVTPVARNQVLVFIFMQLVFAAFAALRDPTPFSLSRAKGAKGCRSNSRVIRMGGRIFWFSQVVAFCDHLYLLCSSERKHKVFRKSIQVPFNLFVLPVGRNTIKPRKISIQYYLLPTD